MSREIKFRAWDSFKKEMVYCDGNHYWAFFDDPISIGYGLYHRNDNHRVLSGEYFPPAMQFTGNHDKAGKEIYESDVLLSATGKEKYKVVWAHSGWFLQSIEGRQTIKSLHQHSARQTIIGNIYENPHLL